MTVRSRTRILIAGVGGQGVLTVARYLGDAALQSGLEVMVGQLHGMSQRGGSVEATVLLGAGCSSFIGAGEADVVLGLEPMETLRALPRMSGQTRVVVSTGPIVPFGLAYQGRFYPEVEGMLQQILQVTGHLVRLDGPALVHEAGDPRSLNLIMLGVLAGQQVLPFSAQELWDAVRQHTRPGLIAGHRRAFELGLGAAGICGC